MPDEIALKPEPIASDSNPKSSSLPFDDELNEKIDKFIEENKDEGNDEEIEGIVDCLIEDEEFEEIKEEHRKIIINYINSLWKGGAFE